MPQAHRPRPERRNRKGPGSGAHHVGRCCGCRGRTPGRGLSAQLRTPQGEHQPAEQLSDVSGSYQPFPVSGNISPALTVQGRPPSHWTGPLVSSPFPSFTSQVCSLTAVQQGIPRSPCLTHRAASPPWAPLCFLILNQNWPE